jgi:hypothetical protein
VRVQKRNGEVLELTLEDAKQANNLWLLKFKGFDTPEALSSLVNGHVMIPDHGPRTGIVGKTDSFRHVPDGKVAFGHGHRQDAERIYALLQEHPLQDPVGTRFAEMEGRIHVAVSVLGEVSAAFGHDFLLAGAGGILPENDDSCLHVCTFAVLYIILLIFRFIRYSYA